MQVIPPPSRSMLDASAKFSGKLVHSIAAFVFVSALVMFSPFESHAQRDRFSINEKRFDEIAKMAEEHLDVLSIRNEKLEFALPQMSEAQQLTRTLSGGFTSGGGGGSPGRWNYHMYDINTSYRFAEGVDRLNHLDKRKRKFFAIEEKNFPFRSSMISENAAHLELFTSSLNGHKVAWLRQGEEGTTAVLISEENAKHCFGRSLAELIVKHDMGSIAAELKANCLPISGMGSPERIIDLVIELTLIDEVRVAEIKQAWADLEADDFKTRDSAAKKLKKHVPKGPAEFAFVLLNPQLFSVPIRAAFGESVKEAARNDSDDDGGTEAETKALKKLESDKSAIRSVVEGKLHKDPAVLVRALARVFAADFVHKDNKQLRLALVKELEAVSKKQFGDDLAKWQAWQLQQLNASLKNVEPDASEKDEAPETDGDTKEDLKPAASAFARTDLAKLLVLTVDKDNRINLDRQQWKETFHGKPPKEILSDVQRQMKEAGVPGSWVSIGNAYDWDYVDYPQMLFERFEYGVSTNKSPISRFRSRSRTSYRGQKEKSFNREIEIGPVRGKLQMHSDRRGGAGDVKAEYFFVEVFDASDNGELVVRVLEKKGKVFSLVVKSGASSRLLVIGQNESGRCWIHFAQGDNMESVVADSAKKLFDENATWITGDVASFAAEIGIDFSEALGGPLSIENAEPPKEDEEDD